MVTHRRRRAAARWTRSRRRSRDADLAGEALARRRWWTRWRPPARCAPSQHLRPHRGHRLRHRVRPAAPGAEPSIGRPVRQHARLRAGRARCARCPPGVPGELYLGGARRGPRLPAPARRSPPSASSPTRSAAPGARHVPHRRPGALAARPASWSTWAAPTRRSRCAASASSWARWRRRCARHPAVREAVAAVRDGRAGRRRLVGYVVPGDGDRPNGGRAARAPARAAARAHGARRVRGARRAAADAQRQGGPRGAPRPAPEAGRAAAPPTCAPRDAGGGARWPRSGREVLRRDRVGVHDNFFALGGDSILSIQVVPRAAKDGDPAAAAAAVRAPAPSPSSPPSPARRRAAVAEQGPVTGEAPLTPVQRWFFEQALPRRAPLEPGLPLPRGERMDAAVARARGRRRPRAPRRAARPLQPHGRRGGRSASPSRAAHPAVVTLDLSATAATTRSRPRSRAAARRAQATLDLARRARCCASPCSTAAPARPQRLLVAAHHLVVDAVSWRVLLEDLEAAYRASAGGRGARASAEDHLVRALGAAPGRASRAPRRCARRTHYWSARRPPRRSRRSRWTTPAAPTWRAPLDAVFAGARRGRDAGAAGGGAARLRHAGERRAAGGAGAGVRGAGRAATRCWWTWRATAARTCSTTPTPAAPWAGSPPCSPCGSTRRGGRRRGAAGGEGDAARGAAAGDRLRDAALGRASRRTRRSLAAPGARSVTFNYLGQVDGGPMGGGAAEAESGGLLLPDPGVGGARSARPAPRAATRWPRRG